MRAVTDSRVDDDIDGDIDAAIEAAIDRVIGKKAYFSKRNQTCEILNISISTHTRGVNAGLIKTVPRGDYEATPRHALRLLMKRGFGSTTGGVKAVA
jgi:hypothetical protein